jgi:hypothetical protein
VVVGKCLRQKHEDMGVSLLHYHLSLSLSHIPSEGRGGCLTPVLGNKQYGLALGGVKLCWKAGLDDLELLASRRTTRASDTACFDERQVGVT